MHAYVIAAQLFDTFAPRFVGMYQSAVDVISLFVRCHRSF